MEYDAMYLAEYPNKETANTYTIHGPKPTHSNKAECELLMNFIFAYFGVYNKQRD